MEEQSEKASGMSMNGGLDERQRIVQLQLSCAMPDYNA